MQGETWRPSKEHSCDALEDLRLILRIPTVHLEVGVPSAGSIQAERVVLASHIFGL